MHRPRRRRDEQGAVVPLVAVLLVVVLLCAAFATDLGMQRVARADMQAVADTVALDLARELDGRDAATLAPLMGALAEQSRDRNDGAVGDDATLSVSLGELDGAGRFSVVSGGAVPTAVRVTARTEVDFAFAGVTGVDRGAAQRSAVSVAQQSACFRVGSFAARLDSTTSPLLDVLLGSLLGTELDLDVADYHGLAAAEVTLVELVEAGGLEVGSAEELLALPGLTVGDLSLAVAAVLTNQGKLAEAALLETIAASATTPTFAVGDLLTASPTDRAALEAGLNVLDLLTASAYAAHAGHTVQVPDLELTLPGIGTVTGSLQVTEAPQVGCGGPGTVARTAQVRLDVPVTLPARVLDVPGVGAVALDPLALALSVDLGQAVAELLDLVCGSSGAERLDVRLSSAVVGEVSLTGSAGIEADVGLPLASDLLRIVLDVLGVTVLPAGLPSVRIDTTVTVGAGTLANPYATDVALPLPGAYSTPQGRASGVVLTGLAVDVAPSTEVVLSVPRLSEAPREYRYQNGRLFDAVVDPVLDTVVDSLVNPLVTRLQTQLVAPLSSVLGLQLAGADVWAVPEAVCSGPQLRQ